MQFIDLKAQYKSIENNIQARINTVLEHGKYIMGPEVVELEEKLAHYVGVKHCVSCANGTDALQLALMAKGIGPGDAVFTTTFTFFSTAEVIALAGATPIFVDIDERTFNISAEKLEQAVSQVRSEGKYNPAAIIAVDLFGQPANYPLIEKVATKHNLYLIEDAAQGFGGEINGCKAGSFGDVATTSFFPAKPLGCYGDGGALFTDDDDLADILRSLRVHGKGLDKYDNVRIGLNSRLDTIQAAILLEKLAIFPREVGLRNKVASHYSRLLPDNVIKPFIEPGYRSSWAQYTLQSETRNDILMTFKELGIPFAIYYATCMHQQTVFSELNVSNIELPSAAKAANNVISLPMHPYLTESDLNKVIDALTG